MHLLILILAATLIALKLLDWWTTRRLILSGKGTEGNPLVAALIKRIGLDPALALMVVVIVLTALSSVLMVAPVQPNKAAATLVMLNAGYIWTVFHNWRLIRA